jgi:hypothetical protein
VRLCSLTVDDLLRKKVKHLLDVEECVWCSGMVVDVSDRMDENPLFGVEYDSVDECDENMYWCKLFEEYARGHLQLI